MVMRKGLPAIRLWSLHALLLMGLWSIAHGQARFYGLGFLPGDTASTANAVSDSALVVGYGNQWAFVWRPATGMRALEFPNAQATIAYAVSADGVVAGQAIIGLYGYACYWDEAGAYRIHSRPSMATGVSYNGQTIAGWAENQAARRVVPFALSTDRVGRQVVGGSRTADGNTRAFYWTRTVGMVSLQDHFAGLIPAGWTLTSASGISPNGRYIVGIGQNPQGATEAWLLDTGRNCYSGGDVDGNGCVDDADLLEVLLGFGRVGVADVNCDGIVNDADLLEVLFNFGSGC
jgi:probable HAF family extracellular repeat protein